MLILSESYANSANYTNAPDAPSSSDFDLDNDGLNTSETESYTAALPDFVKLAEAYGCVGIRASTPEELDDKIIEMINTERPVIFDCRVDKQENCFPMIPSGKPHNQMLLGPKDQKENKITGKGKTLV